jgi:hypothetical protein
MEYLKDSAKKVQAKLKELGYGCAKRSLAALTGESPE